MASEHADDTALGPERSRRHSKTSKQKRGDDVKGVNAVTADCSAGCGRACATATRKSKRGWNNRSVKTCDGYLSNQ
jgi:hypothetical protein